MNKMIFAGVDDGYACIKVAVKEDRESPIKTRMFGSQIKKLTVHTGEGKPPDNVYESEGQTYTVLEEGGDDTRFPDYQTSDFNRVLVHHGLYMAGAEGQDVYLTTGLPPGMFFRRGGKNDKLIAEKSLSMSKPVRVSNGSKRLIKVAHSSVSPEAVAAVIDWSTNDDLTQKEDFRGKLMAVVDIGGNTTDVVVVDCRGGQLAINPEKTVSEKIGLLRAKDEILDLLVQHEVARDPGDVRALDTMFQTRMVKLGGKFIDIGNFIDEAVERVGEGIVRAVGTKLGSGAEFDQIFLVGGGAEVFRRNFRFENLVVPHEPQFANARGMLKLSFLSAERKSEKVK